MKTKLESEETKRAKRAVLAADAIPELLKGLEAMSKATDAAVAKWQAEYDTANAEGMLTLNCPKGHRLDVDVEGSVIASMRDGAFKVAFKPCEACAREERTQRWLFRCGAPANLLEASLDNWEPDSAEDQEALENIREYATDVRRGFLLLLGKSCGVGKTHLAVACMRAFRYNAHPHARFVTQTELFRMLRASYGDKKRVEDIIETCCLCDLLVLDEVGVSSGGRDELPTLHHILNSRQSAKLPTVLTGNFATAEEMRPVIGERMIDRMQEAIFYTAILNGGSQRKAARKSYFAR